MIAPPVFTQMKVTNQIMSSVKFINRKPLVYLVPLLLIFPSFIWITLDKAVWKPDQSLFGRASVTLFYTLAYEPAQWLSAVTQSVRTKPPGLVWIGQFFVPLGQSLGSVDLGLLICVLLIQIAALILLYQAIRQLSDGKTLIAITGGLVMASAPLFIELSHQYLVEPLQTLTVVWFILIMSFAPTWSRGFILSQLLLATALAMSAKTTSPLYCFGPGLVALGYAYQKPATISQRLKERKTVAWFVTGIVLSLATLSWYITNIQPVTEHALVSTTGPVAEHFGKADTFFNTLLYWLKAIRLNFFGQIGLIWGTIVVAGGIAVYFTRPHQVPRHFTWVSLVSLIQIMAVLSVFSFSSNRDPRFLLPLLPYFVLLICWGLARINRLWPIILTMVIFTGQLLAIHGQALGLIASSGNSSIVTPLNTNTQNALTLEAIVTQTCPENNADRYNIVGVDLPWLNAGSVSYFAAKNQLKTHQRCYYQSLGYAQPDLKEAMAHFHAYSARYFITVNPKEYSIPDNVWNQIDLLVLEEVRKSDLAKLEPGLVNDPRILIFSRVGDW
jgi:hypothetical protein